MQCSFGTILDDACDNLTYTKNRGTVEIEKLGIQEKELIMWRTRLRDSEKLCIYAYMLPSSTCHCFRKRFTMNQIKCCDPFKKHKSQQRVCFLLFYFERLL